jgi:hypothetical protein
MCGLRISFGCERQRFIGARVVMQHAVALITILGVGVAAMGAQTSAQASSRTAMQQEPGTAMRAPLNLQISAKAAQASSSADENTDATFNEAKVTPAVPNFAAMMQYDGRSGRSNRPSYGSTYTNADGSDKWMGYGGAGFGVPVGNSRNYLTLGYGFQAGGGRQFSKHFALPVEFDFDHFGFTQQNVNNQTTIYNAYIYDLDPSAGTNALSGLVGGGSHLWSFSIEPTYTFYTGHSFGAYVVGGVGFYHKTAAFTLPVLAFCGGYGYGGYGYGYGGYGYGYGGYGGVCEANATFDKYTSNAPGFDGGAGITYKFSNTSKLELYGEVRYVFVDNSSKPGITVGNLNSIAADTTNFYPANSMHTEYMPIKFGIRF